MKIDNWLAYFGVSLAFLQFWYRLLVRRNEAVSHTPVSWNTPNILNPITRYSPFSLKTHFYLMSYITTTHMFRINTQTTCIATTLFSQYFPSFPPKAPSSQHTFYLILIIHHPYKQCFDVECYLNKPHHHAFWIMLRQPVNPSPMKSYLTHSSLPSNNQCSHLVITFFG